MSSALGPALPFLGITSFGAAEAPQEGVLTESVRFEDFVVAVRVKAATVSDTVGISATLADARGIVVMERIGVQLSQIINHYQQHSLSESLRLTDLPQVGYPLSLTETVSMVSTLGVAVAVTVAEQLNISPALLTQALYGRTITETIGMADSLANFFGAEIIEGIGLHDVMGGYAVRPVTVSETVGVAATIAPVLILSVTVDEVIEISAEQTLNFIWQDEISENIQISAAYVSPNTGITTWVMNTRTGAVSEYDNFAFNSFARMGNKYIAASENGLYELIGDDDDGTDIISRIKSGFAQWGASKFTMFKAAYMAVRGGGDYVLKITTGDGKTYSYGVSARDMRTTKINIGKGVRTHYFAFELISDGDDYDLDKLEFVPIVTDRRI